jgi:hypothetical protein
MTHVVAEPYRKTWLCEIGAQHIDTLAREGWTAQEIATFFKLTLYAVRASCITPPSVWQSAIQRRLHRRRKGA